MLESTLRLSVLVKVKGMNKLAFHSHYISQLENLKILEPETKHTILTNSRFIRVWSSHFTRITTQHKCSFVCETNNRPSSWLYLNELRHSGFWTISVEFVFKMAAIKCLYNDIFQSAYYFLKPITPNKPGLFVTKCTPASQYRVLST